MVWLALALISASAAVAGAQEISTARLRVHTRFLAGDSLEGRGAGARGGRLAVEYIATQFRLAGLKSPAGGMVDGNNVAGLVPGSDPALSSEAVIFSAHWDHLGLARGRHPDRIYNGAVDNATGCAILLELGRFWAMLEPRPRRSAVFLAAAEETGTGRSRHYVENPLFPAENTAIAINFDSIYPAGLIEEVILSGAERASLSPAIEHATGRLGLRMVPDPFPGRAHCFRSGHLPFARAGIPAFTLRPGAVAANQSPALLQAARDWEEKHYHKPSDEFREDWDFVTLEQIARLAFLIAHEAANAGRLAAP